MLSLSLLPLRPILLHSRAHGLPFRRGHLPPAALGGHRFLSAAYCRGSKSAVPIRSTRPCGPLLPEVREGLKNRFDFLIQLRDSQLRPTAGKGCQQIGLSGHPAILPQLATSQDPLTLSGIRQPLSELIVVMGEEAGRTLNPSVRKRDGRPAGQVEGRVER